MRHALVFLTLLGLPLAARAQSALGWRLVERSIRRDYPTVAQLPADSLAAWLARGERVVLLDVRTPAEFAVSHLRGARRVAPDALPAALADVPKDARVVAYCSVGVRSSALAERLARAGYGRAYNLGGSLFGWANGGREVVRGEGAAARPVRAVHPYDALWGRLLRADLRAYTPR